MGRQLEGYLCAALAAVAFGVQYTPVKRYEIFDGATFQWFMCSGILIVAFFLALCTGNLGEGSCCSELVILGGMLWALSNYFVLPLVKLLGIGLGFSLYHFVNLMVGYLVGRLGLFGVPRLQGDLLLCDLGCSLILVSFAVMVFVEAEEEEALPKKRGASKESPDESTPPVLLPLVPKTCIADDTAYRESYRRWRMGGSTQAAGDDRVGLLGSAASALFGLSSSEFGNEYNSVGGFGMLSTPRINKRFFTLESNGRRRTSSDSSGSLVERFVSGQAVGQTSLFKRMRLRVIGVTLAMVGGGLCGVQSVPATLHNVKFPNETPLSVVFPQCLGIWVGSTVVYVVYSAVARLWGWPVPHSVIRPAFLSGCIWCLGFAFMIAAIKTLGYSVGYTLDAVGPIVISSLLSITVFREIKGAAQLLLYFSAFTLQLFGVLLIACNGTSG